MILKNLLVVLVISIIMTFSGCSAKEKIIYVDRPVPYSVPVKCVIPEVVCSFDGNGSEPILRLLECVVDQKKAIEVCK